MFYYEFFKTLNELLQISRAQFPQFASHFHSLSLLLGSPVLVCSQILGKVKIKPKPLYTQKTPVSLVAAPPAPAPPAAPPPVSPAPAPGPGSRGSGSAGTAALQLESSFANVSCGDAREALNLVFR